MKYKFIDVNCKLQLIYIEDVVAIIAYSLPSKHGNPLTYMMFHLYGNSIVISKPGETVYLVTE